MAAADLCTLAEVRERRQTADTIVTQDVVVSRVITSVAAAIATEYKREFTPTAAAARVFEIRSGWDALVLTPYELRAVTAVTVDPGGETPIILDPADYRLAPRPAVHGTYHRLRLRAGAVPFTDTAWDSKLIEITGDWGFAAIPDDVREAAILSVVHNMRTTVGQYSVTDGAGGETRYERAEIPQAARDLLQTFQRKQMYF